MRRHLVLATAVTIALCGSRTTQADSWIFCPSYYTHDPATGERVAQFAPGVTPSVAIDPTYQRSGYVHNETTLQVGESADHTHIVETWGQGASIRPYGEWLYPYRPGATPYNPGGPARGPWNNLPGAMANPYGVGPTPYAPYASGMAQPYAPSYPAPYYPATNPGPYAPPASAPYSGPNPSSSMPSTSAPSNPAPSAPLSPAPGDASGT
jgi:hypothetical protein